MRSNRQKPLKATVNRQLKKGAASIVLRKHFQGRNQTRHQLHTIKTATPQHSTPTSQPIFPSHNRNVRKNDATSNYNGQSWNWKNRADTTLWAKHNPRSPSAQHQPPLCPRELPPKQRQLLPSTAANSNTVPSNFPKTRLLCRGTTANFNANPR